MNDHVTNLPLAPLPPSPRPTSSRKRTKTSLIALIVVTALAVLTLIILQSYRTLLGTRAPQEPSVIGEGIVGGRLKGELLPPGEHTLEFRAIASDGSQISDQVKFETAPPAVADSLRVSSSQWSPEFVAAVDPDKSLGYPIVRRPRSLFRGPRPLLPWTNINQLHVQFSADPLETPQVEDFMLIGTITKSHYNITAVTYDASQRWATLTLDEAIGPERDLQLIALRRYVPGHFDVLPGDVNQDGIVAENDITLLQRGLGRTVGDEAYSIFADLNGSGGIAVNDIAPLRANLGKRLPPDPSRQAEHIVDTNGDQVLTSEEWQAAVNEFTRLLIQSGPEQEYKADFDMNRDGSIDELDIDLFTQMFSSISNEKQVRLSLLKIKALFAIKAQFAGQDSQLSADEHQKAVDAFTNLLLQTPPVYDKLFDLNGDGAVNNQDIAPFKELARFVSNAAQYELLSACFEGADDSVHVRWKPKGAIMRFRLVGDPDWQYVGSSTGKYSTTGYQDDLGDFRKVILFTLVRDLPENSDFEFYFLPGAGAPPGLPAESQVYRFNTGPLPGYAECRSLL